MKDDTTLEHYLESIERTINCFWHYEIARNSHNATAEYEEEKRQFAEITRLARLGARIEAMQPGECLYRDALQWGYPEHPWQYGDLTGYDICIETKKSTQAFRHESATAAIEAWDKE